jgi:urocanate hydratase
MLDQGPASPTTPRYTMPAVERVRAHYGPLCALAEERYGVGALGGRLLLVDGLAAEHDALILAASIAGAATLVLESQPAAVRYAVRNGVVDFAVMTLEEALRILKNEIRKQQPIAVLLEQEPSAALRDMIRRGAQPDLIRWPQDVPQAQVLRQRGAADLPAPASGGDDAAGHVVWRADSGGSAALRQVDLLASQSLSSSDATRQNWITRAPRYLHRGLRLERCATMNDAEVAAFLAAVEEHSRENALAAPVHIEARGQVATFGQTSRPTR